ncbi:MAG: rRNA pseudouridine synthase [Nanoarchaeota archaeon]|nr:rRNA pseudouridine synthase [Nanoarchaeota archaeon]
MKIYLHQFMTRTGLFKSKQEVIDEIRSGTVFIKDKPNTNPYYQFASNKPVTWKGKQVNMLDDKIYLIINKPEGYLSTRLSETDKKLGKKSVYDLIDLPQDKKNTLFGAGRLDEDTSGLLFITNDGKLCIYCSSPGNVTKTYRAALSKEVTEKDMKKIQDGVTIKLEVNGVYEEYKTKPAQVKKISDKEVELVMEEGKKREVRRIFEAIGNHVDSLVRVAIGSLKLSDLGLAKGKYKLMDRKTLEQNFKKKEDTHKS